ncbi:MAG: hypothetical protein AAFP13_15465 [Pseudomonadota bacterium]
MTDLTPKAFVQPGADRARPGAEAAPVEPGLSQDELRALRRLMAVASVDPASGTLTLETGQSRVTLRPNGTLRLEGRAVTQVAQGVLRLHGAAIELN